MTDTGIRQAIQAPLDAIRACQRTAAIAADVYHRYSRLARRLRLKALTARLRDHNQAQAEALEALARRLDRAASGAETFALVGSEDDLDAQRCSPQSRRQVDCLTHSGSPQPPFGPRILGTVAA
jgi:hypothetical protein